MDDLCFEPLNFASVFGLTPRPLRWAGESITIDKARLKWNSLLVGMGSNPRPRRRPVPAPRKQLPHHLHALVTHHPHSKRPPTPLSRTQRLDRDPLRIDFDRVNAVVTDQPPSEEEVHQAMLVGQMWKVRRHADTLTLALGHF